MNIFASRPVLYAMACAGVVLAGFKLYSNEALPNVGSPRPEAPPAPDQAITAFIKSTEAALMSGQFDRLEAEAQADRNVDVRFAGGYSKIRYFYHAIGSFGRSDNCGCGKVMYSTDLTFGQKLHALDKWRTEIPSSMTVSIAMAELWQSLAWNARGHEMADRTPAQAMRLFTQRETLAAGYLVNLNPKLDPAIYEVYLDLTRGMASGADDYTSIFAKAVRSAPTYFFYYGAMASLLEPRWYGGPGGLEFYLKSISTSGGNTGLIIYSFTAEALLSDYDDDDLFTKTGLDWPTLKHAFALRKARYGSSFKVLNVELEFAAAAGDRDYASDLLQNIGSKWEPNVWRNWNSFSRIADWAEASHDARPHSQSNR